MHIIVFTNIRKRKKHFLDSEFKDDLDISLKEYNKLRGKKEMRKREKSHKG